MRVKLKHVSKQIKLTLSDRQKRKIQRLLGYRFEATIINEGLLLHTTKAKYNLKDLMAQCDPDVEPYKEYEEWMITKPVGKELL